MPSVVRCSYFRPKKSGDVAPDEEGSKGEQAKMTTAVKTGTLRRKRLLVKAE